jgi:hypothetical protein
MVVPVVHPDDGGVEPHFDDFEWRDLSDVGRSAYRFGGTALHLGLQAVTKMASLSGPLGRTRIETMGTKPDGYWMLWVLTRLKRPSRRRA